MDWIEQLKPPRLERALDRLGLTEPDRAELRARWITAIDDNARLAELAALYERYFIQGDPPEDCDPIDAALLALLQVPVLERAYQELKIEETVLDATLADVGRWMAKERRVAHRFGLTEFGWVMHGLTLELVQLGSLHFMPAPGTLPVHAFQGPEGAVLLAEGGQRYREDGWGALAEGLPEAPVFTTVYEEHDRYVVGHLLDRWGRCSPRPIALHTGRYTRLYRPGDLVCEVHIPEGTDLSPQAVRRSFELALTYDRAPFIGRPQVFTCHSWMLSPQLEQLVPGSRLAAFSRLWHRVALERAGSAQFWERVFDFTPVTRQQAPRDTQLRRALLDYPGAVLDSGGLLFSSDFSAGQ